MAIGTPASIGTAISGTTTVSTKTFTTNANIVAGDLVVVAIGYYNSGTSPVAISSVTDGTNSYTQALSVTPSGSSPATIALYYKENATAVGSGASLVVTWGSNTFAQGIVAARVTGIASASSLDVTQSATTGTNSPTVASGTLNSASEIIFGFLGGYNTSTYTEDGTFTNIGQVAPNGDNASLAYQIVSATGSVTYAPTTTGGISFSPIGLATFKAAATAVIAGGQRLLLGVG
jgi:hypothetical protein